MFLHTKFSYIRKNCCKESKNFLNNAMKALEKIKDDTRLQNACYIYKLKLQTLKIFMLQR